VDKEGKGQVGTPQKSVFHQQHPAAARSTGHIREIQGTSGLHKERMLPACHVQPENEQLPCARKGRVMNVSLARD
jgi:hypothetical protein